MFKKHGKQCIGKSKGGWNTKLHVVSADDKTIIEMHLSGGNKHDAPEGRYSIEKIGNEYQGIPYLMDKAYEGDKNRLDPWEYDIELYKRRNIIERLFRWLKEFRKVFTRYDKLDSMYLSFIQFACILKWSK